VPASIVEPSVREPTPVPDLAAPPATSRVREGRKAPAAGLMGDLRVAALEKRIQDNDWQGIVKDFGNLEEIGRLPPNLGLLAALAHHEASEEGDQAAVEVGVRCVAGILALPESSAIAGVVTRRLFRRNPTRFHERKAPAAHVSLIIILVALVLGGTVGWVLTGGAAQIRALEQRITHPTHR